MSKTKFKPWKPTWSNEQLRADIRVYNAQYWAKALKAYEKNPKDFYTAYYFLVHHPANQVMGMFDTDSYFDTNYDVMVVKVDPKTNRISDKKKRNTKTQVWIEWGPWSTAEELEKHSPGVGFENGCRSHDTRVDTGGKTFENAIVNLAHNVWALYKDQPDVSNKAKLKKKDRW